MFGYGYGAIDIWLYKSTYDVKTTSNDGVEKITPADKQVPWCKSVEFPSALQMAHLRKFFTSFDWWNLKPCFGDAARFTPREGTAKKPAKGIASARIAVRERSAASRPTASTRCAGSTHGRASGRTSQPRSSPTIAGISNFRRNPMRRTGRLSSPSCLSLPDLKRRERRFPKKRHFR